MAEAEKARKPQQQIEAHGKKGKDGEGHEDIGIIDPRKPWVEKQSQQYRRP
jgi:hypothetical protein